MQMQEPEQQQQWQTGQEYDAYRGGYSGARRYEADQQQTYEEGLAANDYQDQKIYPQPGQSQRGKVLAILGIIFSSIGFFVTLAGIIISALVLQFSHGRHVWLVGGGIGLAASILAMLVCIAIFVLSVVWLALRSRRARRRTRYQSY